MTFQYSNYKVEIKNLKYTTDDGRVFPKTAIVTLFDENNMSIAVELFGFLETEKLYKMIDKKEHLNLDNCLVKNFSLSVYRSERGLEKKEYVELNGFSASNSFFESKFGIDFSFSEFSKGDLSFEGAHFSKGNVSFNSARFGDGDVNFSNALFRDGNIDFANAIFGSGDFNFKNSVIHDGKKDFQYTGFGKGLVSFANTEFNSGQVSFINTDFNDGEVSFKIARFKGGIVEFHYSKFGKGNISFERTEFGNSNVNFRAVEFNEGRINFNRSIFGDGNVSFEGSQVKKGKFGFKRAKFGKGNINFELAEYDNSELTFDNTDFGEGDISFHNSRFNRLSMKSCHLDHYLDLRVAKCNVMDLSDTIVRDIIDFQPYDFDVDIQLLDLTGMRLLGRINIDWHSNRVEKIIKEQKESTYRRLAEQFRMLKENFRLTGKYSDEDKAYIQFKRHEARADLHESIKRNPIYALWQYPAKAFQWLVFDQVGLYATNPLRVLFSMVVSYLFFSLIYVVLPFISNGRITSSVGDPDHLSNIQVALYHSAITFLTIGYGDYYPSGVIRWVSGVEGFVGLFLMSYFTVAFVRKILR
ncbi:MAG: hypothetical protein IIB05_04360 [Bacteroidetes bacterium]|nr:hypothetical protein [Bacteroidota bacterium]